MDFFLGVVELEGQDRKAVDHEAGGFGIQLSLGRGGVRPEGVESGEEFGVALLHEVVAELVETVDGALGFGEIVIGGLGGAGAVFDVPEVEVGAVLGEDGVEEIVAGGRMGLEVLVPEGGGAVMEGRNF